MGSVEPHDVLIVGAGPVGLALALDLRWRGVHATIVARESDTRTELQAKSIVVDERTMKLSRLLGVRDGVIKAGYPNDHPDDTVFCTALDGKYIGRVEMPSAREGASRTVCRDDETMPADLVRSGTCTSSETSGYCRRPIQR